MKKGFAYLERVFGSKTKAQEILFLLEEVKETARQGFYPEELREVEKFCAEMNLHLVKSKFKVLLADGEAYSNKGIKVDENDSRGMQIAYISKDEKKAYLASYYELVGDEKNLGLALGYPLCCVNFFCKNFGKEGFDLQLEPTNEWTNLARRAEDCVLISHFPCSSDCEKSIELGQRYFVVLKKYDYERAKEMMGKLKVQTAAD